MHDPQRQPPATPLYCLSRTVRFNLPLNGALDDTLDGAPSIDFSGGTNGEGGKPPMRGFGAHYAFEVRCVGVPDPETGYLINIKEIDRAVRSGIVPRIARAARDGASPDSFIPTLLAEADKLLPVAVRSVALHLSPTLRVEATTRDANGEIPDTNSSETERAMPTETATQPARVIVRQTLEFSAAHRLHVPSLDDDENARIFGKCNNPAGHGHNYRLLLRNAGFEVCVAQEQSVVVPMLRTVPLRLQGRRHAAQFL